MFCHEKNCWSFCCLCCVHIDDLHVIVKFRMGLFWVIWMRNFTFSYVDPQNETMGSIYSTLGTYSGLFGNSSDYSVSREDLGKMESNIKAVKVTGRDLGNLTVNLVMNSKDDFGELDGRKGYFVLREGVLSNLMGQ